MTARTLLVIAQGATFLGLAVVFALAGDWRLAGAQGCLAIVTACVYV